MHRTRLTVSLALAVLLGGCYSLDAVVFGALGSLAGSASASRGEEPARPNASTYVEIGGLTVPDSVSAADVAGAYSMAGGHHGRRYLRLHPDGTASYRVLDAAFRVDTTVVGRWSIGGRWSAAQHALSLDVPAVTTPDGDGVEGDHSPLLEVVREGGRYLLVPLDHKGAFLRSGPSDWSAFVPDRATGI